jgi:hypothetical protein
VIAHGDGLRTLTLPAVQESALKKSFIGYGLWACVPFAAFAQALVTDPASPVPAVGYRSVFSDMPKGVETETLDWKAANAEVGQFTRGHIDILKWEAAQKKAAATGAPATPSSGGARNQPQKP